MKELHLLVGGLVAMGFDSSGAFLLTVSHSGRGVFSTNTWTRVHRDQTVVYPANGVIEGIGPLAGKEIAVISRNEFQDRIILYTSDGSFELLGESDGILVNAVV